MSESVEVGKIGWIDMTVADAPAVRDFYKAVVGAIAGLYQPAFA